MNKEDKVNEIIDALKGIEVDGETMQHIIEKVGMHDQMLRQLIMTSPYSESIELLDEKTEIDNTQLKKFCNRGK